MKAQLFHAYILCLFICVCTAPTAQGQALYEAPSKSVQSGWTSFENPTGAQGSGGKENKGAKGHALDILQPKEKKTLLDLKGAGVITRIWLTVNERSPQMLRAMRVEMYWDNSATPAVSAPLGDFFGIALGRKTAFESEFFSDPEGRSFNCVIPMPYKTAARIVFINESDKIVHLFYDVNFLRVEKHEKEVYYFHAYWSRENKTKLEKDFVVLPELKGRGRFLGMNVGVITDSIYDKSWWGEGEVKIFLDGDSQFPSLIGTGTEDYIGTAWGQGKYSNRFQGCPVAEEENHQWAFYRYHVPDPIYFQQQCKVTLQQIGGEMTDNVRKLINKGARLKPISVSGDNKFIKLLEMNPVPKLEDANFPKGWTNFYREDDVSATAYFYLDRPSNGLPPIAALELRTAGLSDK